MQRPLFLAFLVLLFSAGSASATTVSFQAIDCKNCSTLGSQLGVTLVPLASGRVGFLLSNVGSESLNATGVFFDDAANVLADLFDVTDFSGVDFAEGGKPKDLKSGNKIDFVTEFLANAAKPTKDNGVGQGQNVQINFTLASGKTIDDVIAALDSGALRIGINAKKGYLSESGAVPEPALGMLLALGGLAAAWAARRS